MSPSILVCNDDGIFAPGIRALIEEVQKLGDVTIVAPDSPQSGKGMAITLDAPLFYEKVTIFDNVKGYAVSGTPVDCIKLAVNEILEKKPDLIVSGINHGSNASINVIYSGTMSAALEGALENIPSIGFSLLNHSMNADFSASKKVVNQIVGSALNNAFPENVCLNVNIPDGPYEKIKGIKVCRQAKANWEEEFDQRTNPFGRKYFWMTGTFKNYDKNDDTDIWALEHDFVSVVPVQQDLTAHKVIDSVNSWGL
ncbi:MAG: 5'/3'-nucleotidase SurE [Flavobacteriales bacterium]|nr:5'/3'-nucleotidase SurE [Flavobacteriales bacterium]